MATKQSVVTTLTKLKVPHLLTAFNNASDPSGSHRGWIDIDEMKAIISAASNKGPQGVGPTEWQAILEIGKYDKIGPKAKTHLDSVKKRWNAGARPGKPSKPAFSVLKGKYSTQRSSVHACSMHFPNTCAIRMSEALVRTDARFLAAFKKSSKNKCPHGYVRGAQDLGAILGSSSVWGRRNHGWNAQKSGAAPASATGKKGLVCYMNIPGFSGQGHIDLWDGSQAVGDAYWNAQTIWMWTLS